MARDAKGRFIKGSGGASAPKFTAQGALGMSRLRALAASLGAPGQSPILRGVALDLVGTIKKTLSQPGSGATYGRHTASAPGQPPAPDSGALRSSTGMEARTTSILVGVGAPYGEALEFGTPTIEPRPFMRPAGRLVAERWKGMRVAALLKNHTGKVLHGN